VKSEESISKAEPELMVIDEPSSSFPQSKVIIYTTKFLSLWEGLFIIVDVAAPGAYMLVKVDGVMLPNTWSADQLCKYYV
jgi:hypothetical protein